MQYFYCYLMTGSGRHKVLIFRTLQRLKLYSIAIISKHYALLIQVCHQRNEPWHTLCSLSR